MTGPPMEALKGAKKPVLSEGLFKLVLEGRVDIAKGRKLKYGKYRIVRRLRLESIAPAQ